MISFPIVIDGITYENVHVTDIDRSFQIVDGENAGRLLNGSMRRDVVGTFYNYSFAMDADAARRQEYDRMFEVLSAPQDAHTIQVPYAQSILTFRAYVTNGSDKLEDMGPNFNRWGGLKWNFIAMDPQRTPYGR